MDLAAAGIVLQAFGKIAHPLLSTGFYLAMGWTVLAGGVAFFLMDSRLKFSHSIWHLFVLAGSAILSQSCGTPRVGRSSVRRLATTEALLKAVHLCVCSVGRHTLESDLDRGV